MRLLARSEWGAREPWSVSTIRTPSRRLILHHAAVPGTGPSKVRDHQRFHMDSRGYSDIAYNWLADDQQGYEGRGAGVQGAHTRGHNDEHAVCALGDFTSTDPSDALLDMLAELAVHAWRIGAVDQPAYDGGHRDYGTTSCPGDRLYRQIPEINRRAKALAEGTDVRTYAQAIVVPHDSDWDRALGAVVAATYELGLVETSDGRTFRSLTHHGVEAELGDWAGVVGAAKYRLDVGLPPGTRIAGDDRWATVDAVVQFLAEHDRDGWPRRGVPT